MACVTGERLQMTMGLYRIGNGREGPPHLGFFFPLPGANPTGCGRCPGRTGSLENRCKFKKKQTDKKTYTYIDDYIYTHVFNEIIIYICI